MSPQSQYAESTFSTSTTYTEFEKPLNSFSESKKSSKSKLWKKTKKAVASALEVHDEEYYQRVNEKRRAQGKPEKSYLTKEDPFAVVGVVGSGSAQPLRI